MFDTEADDITELCEVLTPIEAKWECFGTQLGILKTDAIGLGNNYKPALCLKGVLDTWLQKDYNTAKHGHPSWRKVCKATASKAVGNRRLADDIAKQHRQSAVPEQG